MSQERFCPVTIIRHRHGAGGISEYGSFPFRSVDQERRVSAIVRQTNQINVNDVNRKFDLYLGMHDQILMSIERELQARIEPEKKPVGALAFLFTENGYKWGVASLPITSTENPTSFACIYFDGTSLPVNQSKGFLEVKLPKGIPLPHFCQETRLSDEMLINGRPSLRIPADQFWGQHLFLTNNDRLDVRAHILDLKSLKRIMRILTDLHFNDSTRVIIYHAELAQYAIDLGVPKEQIEAILKM